MAALRPFKFTPKTGESVVVQAASMSVAQRHFEKLAMKDIVSEVAPLTAAEYKTVDFQSETFDRIPGGKEDATVTPFRLTLGGETIYKLATSQAKAEAFLQNEIQRVAGFTVEPLPVEEYPTTDWANVEIIETSSASDNGEAVEAGDAAPKKAKGKKGAATEGDADKQQDLSDIPGME